MMLCASMPAGSKSLLSLGRESLSLLSLVSIKACRTRSTWKSYMTLPRR